jgi:hypothetical protein
VRSVGQDQRHGQQAEQDSAGRRVASVASSIGAALDAINGL